MSRSRSGALLWALLVSWCCAAGAQEDAGASEAGVPSEAGAVSDTGASDAGDGSDASGVVTVAVGQEIVPLLPGDRSGLPSVLVLGPDACPSSQRLVAELEASEGNLRLRPVDSGPADFVVLFRPWGERYDAEIKDSVGRVRSLEGDGSGCAELARAVGLSLLVLVDAAAQERRASPPKPGPPSKNHIHAETGYGWRKRFGASLGVGGVLAPLPVVGAYARFSGAVEISAWFLYGLGYTKTHGPGQVALSWLGVGSDVCYVFFDLLGLCGGGWAGRLSATGSGYDRNSSVARWQPGLSFGARFRGSLSDHWEVGLTGMGLVALTQERITVANVEGAAFTTPRINPLVSLEIGARF